MRNASWSQAVHTKPTGEARPGLQGGTELPGAPACLGHRAAKWQRGRKAQVRRLPSRPLLETLPRPEPRGQEAPFLQVRSWGCHDNRRCGKETGPWVNTEVAGATLPLAPDLSALSRGKEEGSGTGSEAAWHWPHSSGCCARRGRAAGGDHRQLC